MDINNLNPSDVYKIFVEGISISVSFCELSSYFELNDSDTQTLIDYIESFLEKEVKVSYKDFLSMLKNNKCSFIFGTENTPFIFRCEVTSDNFKDGTFSSGGFCMIMNNLTMIEVGGHKVFFGYSNDVSYRFCF